MAIQQYPPQQATSTGAGEIVYSFIPEANAEYVTPLLVDDAVYKIEVNSSDPLRSAGISLEIYTTDLVKPKELVTVFADTPVTWPKPITKIKVINGSYTYTGNTTANATTGGRYEQNGLANYSILSIRKFSKVLPARTGTDQESSFGDIYVHTEQHPDWDSTGLLQAGGALNNGESGYGWNAARKWVGWSYNWNYTGTYRIGRANQVTNAKSFQYKALDSMTWTTLAPIPTEIEFYNVGNIASNEDALSRAHIMDTELVTYVLFRKKTTPLSNQTIAGQTGTFNQLLYKYTKATNTWAAIGAYNVTTWADSTHTWGSKMFFITTTGGVDYLHPWQLDRTGNSWYRYNLSTGTRDITTAAGTTWHEGTYVGSATTGKFFVSPTQGIGNTDSSATNYQLYDPQANSWTSINPPSQTSQNGTIRPSTYGRGGSVFRWSPTEVAVIGRRTYTTNNSTLANNDRWWHPFFWVYDLTASAGNNWIDKSETLGNYYPSIMRPMHTTENKFVYQPQTSDWDGRFFTLREEESGYRNRGNYEYYNLKRPMQVTLLGQTGHARGEMSVGSWSVLAFGTLRNVEQAPHTYQTPGGVDFGGESWNGFNTWGMEIVYVDGTVKYGPRAYCPQNTIYNPTRNVWYTSGWEYARSKFVSTSSQNQWQRMSYIVDEKTGSFTQITPDFYDTSGDRAWIETYAAGLAYNDVVHLNRPYDADAWYVTNLIGYNSEGSTYRNRAFTDYKWHSFQPGGNTARTGQGLGMASDQRTNQVVQWGKGPRNIYGFPEGTLFWDGSTLRMYNYRDIQFPFSSSLTARDVNNTVGRQSGWRIIYTTPNIGARTTYTNYGTPKVWRDENWAICQNSTMDMYYVFDLNNLYTKEPKVMGSHLPIESSETPQNNAGQSATIGSSSWRWMKNAANVAGVEIIYGHMDHVGYRSWYNDNIYIVRQYPIPTTNLLDKN